MAADAAASLAAGAWLATGWTGDAVSCDCCLWLLQAERLDAKASGLAAAISALEAQVEAEAGRARVEARARVSLQTLYRRSVTMRNPGAGPAVQSRMLQRRCFSAVREHMS